MLCVFVLNLVLVCAACAAGENALTEFLFGPKKADDCAIPDMTGLTLNAKSFVIMGKADNSYEEIRCSYHDSSDRDLIYLIVRHYASGRRTDGMADVNTYSSLQPSANYQYIEAIPYSDATRRFSSVLRYNDPANMSMEVLANRDIVEGDCYIFIDAEFRNHYSDEEILSMLAKVEAKARSLILPSTSPAPTLSVSPSVSPAPLATKTPIVSVTPSPSGWQWPGWATLETTLPQSNKGMVRSWFGTVEVMGAGSSVWKPAHAGEYLDAGAKVRTLEGGRAELSLYGGRVVRLDPDSILEIPVKYPVETIGDYIRIIKGEFWLSIDKIQNPLMYIETSNAITAVKGTKFEVVVDDTGTTVRVFEGVVEVSDLNRTKNVSVGANQKVVVPVNSVPLSRPVLIWRQ